MFKGLEWKSQSTTDLILSRLNETKLFTFHLTGSRFFGNDRPDSDWDFFVQHNPQTIKFLIELGFEALYDTPYNDVEISSVYRHSLAKVDVQVVRNAVIKEKIQRLIATHYEWKYMLCSLPREMRGSVWDLVYTIAINGDVDKQSQHVIPIGEKWIGRPLKSG